MISEGDRRSRNYRYTKTADEDVAGVLRYTAGRFGPRQRQRYAELIDRAASLIAADPMRAGSHPKDELGPGVRSFHIELAARRRGAGAHVLYYISSRRDDGSEGVIILRVLYERMDPARHIIEDE